MRLARPRSIGGKRGDAVGEPRHAIEPAEDRQVLPDRQPVGHIHIRALEVHPVQDLVTLAGHLGAQDAHAARSRRDEAQDGGDGRRLASAVAAQEAGDRAPGQYERDVVHRPRVAIGLDQSADGDGGRDRQGFGFVSHGSAHVTCGARARKPRCRSPAGRRLAWRSVTGQSATVERTARRATFAPCRKP